MFETHLGLRENPFAAGHQPRYVYPSREHQEALAHLRFGIEHREPFVLITGEVGTGKTTAIYDALHGWGTRAVVALVTNSSLTRTELLEEIALRFGLALPPATSKPQAMVQLERHLLAIRQRGELAVLLMDEAQNLDRELLEEIRLLSNLEMEGQKLLQIFLVGQPELEAKLASHELRQLRQRIAVHYRINPLSREETEHYIHHRVAVAGGNAYQLFPAETCLAVYRLTHGIPREINTVCGQALVNAYVEDATSVRPEHVHSVARDSDFHSVLAAPAAAPTADELLAVEASDPAAAERETERARAAAERAAEERAAAEREAERERVAAAERERMEREAAERAQNERAAREQAERTRAEAERVEREAAERAREDARRAAEEADARARAEAERSALDAEQQMAAAEREAQERFDRGSVEQSPVAPAKGGDFQMPDWLDHAIAQHQPEPGEATPASVPPVPVAPPAPSRGSAVPPVSTMHSGPAPARIAPHPSAPIGTGLRPDFLPSRLREKIVESETSSKSSRAMPWLVAAVLIAVVGISVLLVLRFDGKLPWKTSPTTGVAASPSPVPQTTGPSPQPVATQPSPSPAPAPTTPAATPKPEPVAETPKPAPKKPAPTHKSETAAAGVTAATKPAATATKRSYGVIVGTFLDQERAQSEATRMGAASGLPSRTMTVQEDGAAVYRVVLGRFDTNTAAEHAASDLIVKGLSNEARVVTYNAASK